MTQATETVAEQIERAAAFTREHLPQCCAEVVRWGGSGTLPEGKVRELARLCSFANHRALSVAVDMVRQAALEHVAVAAAREPA